MFIEWVLIDIVMKSVADGVDTVIDDTSVKRMNNDLNKTSVGNCENRFSIKRSIVVHRSVIEI